MARREEDETLEALRTSLMLGMFYLVFFLWTYGLFLETNLLNTSNTIRILIWIGLNALMLYIIIIIYPHLLPHHERRK